MNSSHAILTRLLMVLMVLAMALCAFLMVGQGRHALKHGKGSVGVWVGLSVVAALGTVAGWMAVRLWRKRDLPPPGSLAGVPLW